MTRYLLLLLLLLPACGEQEEENRKERPRGDMTLRVRLGPRVRAMFGSGDYTLRGWGPWMAPVGRSRGFRLPPGESEVRLPFRELDRNLRWLSLEREGRVIACAEVEGVMTTGPTLLVVQEIEIDAAQVDPAKGGRRLLPRLSGKGAASPFGCGLAMARGDKAAIRPLLSPQMNLRSRWILPWRQEEDRYALVVADSTTGPGVWEGAQAEWDLDGDAPRQLAAPLEYCRLSTAGFIHRPLPRPATGWGPAGLTGFRAFAPGWETESRQGGALLIGHADWGRFAALVPAAGGAYQALPLWPTAALEVLGKEKDPDLLWAISWEGRRRARVEVLPLGRAAIASVRYEGYHWSFLTVSDSGGLEGGFICGSVPLRVRCAQGGRPLVILETPMLEGARSGGLVFWPGQDRAELRWGGKGRADFTHRGRMKVAPGGLEGIAVTRPGE